MKHLILFSLLLCTALLGAEIDCERGFRAVSASPFPATGIHQWDFAQGNLMLSPEQVFSREFLARLEKVGPVVAIVGRRDGESVPGIPAQRALFIAIRAGEEYVAHVELRRDLWDPGTFYLEDLFTQNPSRPEGNERPSKRYENQESDDGTQTRGLPVEEFHRFGKALEDIIRKTGGKRMRTSGAQDYLVSRLYTSRVRMTPASEPSRQTFEMLNELRRYFASAYPKELREEADTFRNILGTAAQRNLSTHEIEAWRVYQETGKLPEGAAIYPSPQDPKIFTMTHQGERYTAFVDSITPGKPLLQWADLHQSGRIFLEKEIP